eukprot:CAMPEP_0173295404 /NCGR_PEP_ID=MMETSP1143-20121109/14414_1 /TAXON_ID=483371 /ORGANISM="non described non described, Strain CCMP2298" /LENGTH=168 /DNA_ID=CAMNT_0014235197 /DNA_START=144 /DNA_END=650 /DNA_ORIENTATION=+
MTMIAAGSTTPSGMVDIISPSAGEYTTEAGVDFADALKSHKKAVIFAVPGAFTPTCSEKHLPGFIANAAAMKAKGVTAIFCLSVNDKFVMKSWGQATAGFAESGIKLVADGNADYTKAIDLVLNASGNRMGLRCTRFAGIVEDGVFTAVEVDSSGLDKSSAESILALL